MQGRTLALCVKEKSHTLCSEELSLSMLDISLALHVSALSRFVLRKSLDLYVKGNDRAFCWREVLPRGCREVSRSVLKKDDYVDQCKLFSLLNCNTIFSCS